MSTGLATNGNGHASAIEQVLIQGDLAKLKPDERVQYYNAVCQSLGLNPLTKPFAYIMLNGKLTLYALRDCTDQLRKVHGVSVTKLTTSKLDDVFCVVAEVRDASGRIDSATGAVSIGNLKGESLANALMKAETKAKRRATLSICGLGVIDETEAESIPNATTTTHTEAIEAKYAAPPKRQESGGPAKTFHDYDLSPEEAQYYEALAAQAQKPAATFAEWLVKAAVHIGCDPGVLRANCFAWCVANGKTTFDLPEEERNDCLEAVFPNNRNAFRDVANKTRDELKGVPA